MQIFGGKGNDTYMVTKATTQIVEYSNGASNGGIDTVKASIDWTLGKNLDNLVLVQGSDAIRATGNELNNTITGNEKGNILSGGAGADTMVGGLGDDTYVVDNAGDVVIEMANEGTDTVRSAVNYTLGDYIENLTLLGRATEGTGNEAANTIIGNGAGNTLNGLGGNDTLIGGDGKDVLNGGEGNDTLNGGKGKDILIGGNGNDVFVFGSGYARTNGTVTGSTIQGNADVVRDFKSGNDKIALSVSTFASLEKAGLHEGGDFTKDMFLNGKYAKDSNDFFIYDAKTGELWYDANGNQPENGWTGKRLVATFTDDNNAHPKALVYTDFILIA